MAKEAYELYSEVGDPVPNPWAYPTFAAVGPQGQIVVRHLEPGKTGEIGDVPIFVRDGEAGLSPRYARRGWALYEDLCHGRVPGVEADLDAWKRWETLCAVRARGGDLPHELIKWHPEVYRREQDGPSKMPKFSVEQLREMLPGVEIEEPEETAVEAPKAKGKRGAK